MITLDEVRKRVSEIAAGAGDFEVAHGGEDHLWEEVLETIALSSSELWVRALATEALKTRDIEFVRYCA